MEAEIAEGQLGKHLSYDVEFKGGKLTAKLVNPETGISVAMEIPADAVLEALKKAIPGQIDDAILEGAKKLLAQ